MAHNHPLLVWDLDTTGIYFEIPTRSLSSYMYRNGCISKSSVACRDTSLSDNITLRKWGRKATEVVRVIEVIKN